MHATLECVIVYTFKYLFMCLFMYRKHVPRPRASTSVQCLFTGNLFLHHVAILLYCTVYSVCLHSGNLFLHHHVAILLYCTLYSVCLHSGNLFLHHVAILLYCTVIVYI